MAHQIFYDSNKPSLRFAKLVDLIKTAELENRLIYRAIYTHNDWRSTFITIMYKSPQATLIIISSWTTLLTVDRIASPILAHNIDTAFKEMRDLCSQEPLASFVVNTHGLFCEKEHSLLELIRLNNIPCKKTLALEWTSTFGKWLASKRALKLLPTNMGQMYWVLE